MSQAYEGSDGRVVVHEDHLEVHARRGERRVDLGQLRGSEFLRPGRFSAGSFTVRTGEGFAPSAEDRAHSVAVGSDQAERFVELEVRLRGLADAARNTGTTGAGGAERSASAQAPQIPLHTLHEVPGRTTLVSLGLVTGVSVLSRNAISDYGSELKSIFGGELGGEQDAYGRALGAATLRIRQRAEQVGAVSVAVQATQGGGQAVIMTGTAVRTAAEEREQPEA